MGIHLRVSRKGYQAGLDWYRQVLTHGSKAKVKGRLGPGKTDEKSIRVLNRTIHWTPSGIEYAVDQRHAEIIVRELGFWNLTARGSVRRELKPSGKSWRKIHC